MSIMVQFEDESFYVKESLVAISGTVSIDSVFVSRMLQLFKNTAYVSSTFSSSVDGSFSFSTNGSKADRFAVVQLGEDGENSQIYDFIDMAD